MNEFSINHLSPNSKIHMIGIGGISMSALAHILLYFNYRVSGSDRTMTPLVQRLQDDGVKIYIGQSADNIESPDLVCYTAAIASDNPELVKARTLGIPVLERAELLGKIMELYKYPLAVAGTHGKTTTTSMLSLVLMEARLNPTILVGGELPQIDGNYKIGGSDYLVLEACEYVESFLHFKPYLSIITNIDKDHLDYFTNLKHIISSFEKFSRLNSPLGYIIVCYDDKHTHSIVEKAQGNVIKYGINDKKCNFKAENIKTLTDGKIEYDAYFDGKYYMSVKLNVSGKHNIYNSLAVVAASYALGIDKEAVAKGLEAFSGAKRRFEKIGETNGFTVLDDYAHHPTEIKSTLETAKGLLYNKVWCIFQPHTYSRTKALLNDFAKSLSIADTTIVTDVYPAREKYDGTIHSCDLVGLIPKGMYMNDFGAIERYIKKHAKPGDLVITMGAGDIFKISHHLCGKE